MKQLGRNSVSESLVLDALNGEIILEGNAKVEDSEWGTVTGKESFSIGNQVGLRYLVAKMKGPEL